MICFSLIKDELVYSMSGQGVPELFDIDFLEGGIYVLGNLRYNGTEVFQVSKKINVTHISIPKLHDKM
jgi:hypothetical protein